MQVFVPEYTYEECAKSLDAKRLNKQVLECTQILDTLLDLPTKTGKQRVGWRNHPAVRMWDGCEGALSVYTEAFIKEMNRRGFYTKTYEYKMETYVHKALSSSYNKPIWWGDKTIHESHRVRLLQKGWETLLRYDKIDVLSWYHMMDWGFKDDPEFFNREYVWASKSTGISYEKTSRVSKQALQAKQKLIDAFGLNPYENVNRYDVAIAIEGLFLEMLNEVAVAKKHNGFHPETFDIKTELTRKLMQSNMDASLLEYAQNLWIKRWKNSVYYDKRGGRFRMATEAPLITA